MVQGLTPYPGRSDESSPEMLFFRQRLAATARLRILEAYQYSAAAGDGLHRMDQGFCRSAPLWAHLPLAPWMEDLATSGRPPTFVPPTWVIPLGRKGELPSELEILAHPPCAQDTKRGPVTTVNGIPRSGCRVRATKRTKAARGISEHPTWPPPAPP